MFAKQRIFACFPGVQYQLHLDGDSCHPSHITQTTIISHVWFWGMWENGRDEPKRMGEGKVAKGEKCRTERKMPFLQGPFSHLLTLMDGAKIYLVPQVWNLVLYFSSVSGFSGPIRLETETKASKQTKSMLSYCSWFLHHSFVSQ